MYENIEKLCKMYGFSWDKIGIYIQIKSKRDTWYIENRDYTWHKIQLYHQNIYGNSYMHKQGKHDNLRYVFIAMYKHDHHEELHVNNKLVKIMNDYRLLGLYN